MTQSERLASTIRISISSLIKLFLRRHMKYLVMSLVHATPDVPGRLHVQWGMLSTKKSRTDRHCRLGFGSECPIER